MNGPEHYREAERDIEPADRATLSSGEAPYLLARAQVHATLALFETDRPTHTHAGDEFVYDGIGKTELERLRSLLSYEDKASLTTWEIIEIAGDELAAARKAATS